MGHLRYVLLYVCAYMRVIDIVAAYVCLPCRLQSESIIAKLMWNSAASVYWTMKAAMYIVYLIPGGAYGRIWRSILDLPHQHSRLVCTSIRCYRWTLRPPYGGHGLLSCADRHEHCR